MADPYPDGLTFANAQDAKTVTKEKMIQSLRAKGFTVDDSKYIYMFQLTRALMLFYDEIFERKNPQKYTIKGDYFSVSHLKEIYNTHKQPIKKGNYLSVNKISDCSTFSKIEYKGCLYYIFGENHAYKPLKDKCTHLKKCYATGNIIDKIITLQGNLLTPVDIYIESKFAEDSESGEVYHNELEYIPFGNLFQYIDMIKKCLTKNKSDCDYKNKARFHYVDTRASKINGRIIRHDPFFKIKKRHKTTTKISKILYKKFQFKNYSVLYTEFLEALFNTSIDLETTPYIVYMLENKMLDYYPKIWDKIQKNISYLPEDIRNDLYRYVMIECGLRFKLIHEKIIMVNSQEKYLEILENKCIKGIFSPVRGAMMDIYLLSRMFRNFGKDHEYSKIKIIYTGGSHSRNYIKFFEVYLKTKPSILEESSKNGLEIPPNSIQLT